MARKLQPAQMRGAGAPFIQSLEYQSSADAFVVGDLLVPDTGNYVKGVGAALSGDTAYVPGTHGYIAGIALAGFESSPGFEMSHDSQVTSRTGAVRKVSSAIPGTNHLFSAGVRSGQTAVRGLTCGLRWDDSEDVWEVDPSDVTNDAVVIEKVFAAEVNMPQFCLFSFLASALEEAS